MKSQGNKKCSCNHKSIKGIKTNIHAVIEEVYKVFDYVQSFIFGG